MTLDDDLRMKRLQAAELHAMHEDVTPVEGAIEIETQRIEHHDSEGYTLILSVNGYWSCHMIFRNDQGFTNIELGYDQIRNYVDIEPQEFMIVAALTQKAAEIMKGGG